MINEDERKRLKKTARIQAMVMIVAGATLLIFQNIVTSVIGLLLILLAAIFAIKGPEYAEQYLIRQRSQQVVTDCNTMSDNLVKKMEDFGEDKRGIVWVWIVALLTWAIMAIAYFALSIVVYLVLDSVEAFIPWGTHTWDAQYLGVIELTRNVCAWFLIIMTVGIIGWALLSSARAVANTGPAY